MKRPPENEKEWVELLKQRDKHAFKQLVKTYEKPVYNLTYRMFNDPSEALDISQIVFLKVFLNIHKFRGEAKLSTWIHSIAMNVCRNRLRYLQRRARDRHTTIHENQPLVTGSANAPHAVIPRPDQVAEGNESEAFLKQSISKLDPEQREVLVLRDIQGLSYEEIGAITGLAPGTVKSRIHRARRSLEADYRKYTNQTEDISHE